MKDTMPQDNGWGFDDLEQMLRYRPLSDVMRLGEARATLLELTATVDPAPCLFTEITPPSLP